MDNTLAYIDQASFLALRALHRGPVIQFTWIFDRAIDVDGVRRFHANLGCGLLGRRIERSVLPFGRDRWVAAAGPAVLDCAEQDRHRDEVWTWADERAQLPTHPQRGPSWHLGLQPLSDGGAALTLVVSHSVGDAKAVMLAIDDAVQGVHRDLGYPHANHRTVRRAVIEDGRQTIRCLPDVGRAVVSAVRVARAERGGLSTSVSSSRTRRSTEPEQGVVVPNAVAFIDIDHWDERARDLNGTSNALFAAVSARLGQIQGRVDGEGSVRLSLPVSERGSGDTRANALTEASVTVDPRTVIADLGDLRVDLRQAFSALAETPNGLLGPLALVPFTPALLIRRLEGMVQQVGSPIGCSNLGELAPNVNRPDGRDAERLAVRMLEPGITTDVLDRMGGLLFLGCGRVRGRVFLTVASWVVEGSNTKASLRNSVRRALQDMALSATVE